ncbi:DinB family protein [Alkalicoccobacillus murimartini]|nr:DinB family protein [Alkalicoccobacillus murimartini]
MKSQYMDQYFDQLIEQRTHFFNQFDSRVVWLRPYEDKWSIGETLYHVYLLLKRFRQLNISYIPLATPFAKLSRHKPYLTASPNIYEQYKQTHKKPMKAPPLLIPPKHIQRKVTYSKMIQTLELETKRLRNRVAALDEDLAGHIRYPDPPAHYPNLIQGIHLLAIHEMHHFALCQNYYEAAELR